MLRRPQKYGLLYIFLFLLVINFYLFYLDFNGSKKLLTFAMLDIGQGDALFIESPTGTQILFDAGPPKRVMGQLAKVMSPFDRSIDAIVLTNPDADHIGGFADILNSYKVDLMFESGTTNDSKTYQNLKREISNKKIPQILAKRGMRLDIGGGAVIDILFPDRDVSEWGRNDGSIVARLSYGNTSVMLTGDATIKTEGIILGENSPEELKSTILKVGHHGSRTSTSADFVKALAPTYAVISEGKDNKYGHPHPETLGTLESFEAYILRTDEAGTIVFKCDTILPCEIRKSKN